MLRWVIVNLVLTSARKSCRKKVSVRNSVAQLPEARQVVGFGFFCFVLFCFVFCFFFFFWFFVFVFLFRLVKLKRNITGLLRLAAS